MYSAAQSCPTLCDPKDCSLPGSSVHGLFQARILEWVTISSSRGSSQPRNRTCVSFIGRLILYCQATRESLGYVLDVQRKHCIWYTTVCMYIYKDHMLYFIKSNMPLVVSGTIFMDPEKRKVLPIKLWHTTDHKVNLNFRNVKMCNSALTKCGCTW